VSRLRVDRSSPNALCSRVEELCAVLDILWRSGWLLQHRPSDGHDSHSIHSGPRGAPVCASQRAGHKRRPSSIRTHTGQWLFQALYAQLYGSGHSLFLATPRSLNPVLEEEERGGGGKESEKEEQIE
jgi:hypothetical protein